MKSYQDYKSNAQSPTQQNAGSNQGWQSTIQTKTPTKKTAGKKTPAKAGTSGVKKGSLPAGRTF